MELLKPYVPVNKVRIVTAASLFDGHDAAINIMRRIIQSTGVEVIHLGHDRSVQEVVNTAIQEDANAIAMTSYQGGHNEYFKYMYDLLQEKGAGHIKIFGGGGGVILPSEIEELQAYGITRIYAPDDGRVLQPDELRGGRRVPEDDVLGAGRDEIGHMVPWSNGKPVSKDGLEFWGQSFIASPDGTVVKRASVQREEVMVVECDLQKVEFARTHWPFLRDRRIDAYGAITERFVDGTSGTGRR